MWKKPIRKYIIDFIWEKILHGNPNQGEIPPDWLVNIFYPLWAIYNKISPVKYFGYDSCYYICGRKWPSWMLNFPVDPNASVKEWFRFVKVNGQVYIEKKIEIIKDQGETGNGQRV